jgi:hypothetical protein
MHNLAAKFKYAVKMVAFAYHMYEANEEIMQQPQALSPSQIQFLNQYPANNEEIAFKTRFIRVVSTYRLFKGNMDLPMYSDSIVRNADGVVEIMLYEYAVGFLLNYYNPNLESFENYYKLSINDQARVIDVINKIKDFLILNDLYPRRINHTADSLRMVTDLFQTTSDGKNGIGMAEGAELIGIIRDSSFIGKDLLKTMIDSELCTADSKGGISTKCYRENFYQVFNRFYKYFPKFKKFVDTNSKNDKENVLQELLKRTEFFSRDCALDSRPIYKKDMSSIVAGLMDIESTIIHFDKNQNNILDYEELNDAFPVYRSAIIGVAKLKPSQEFLAKSIFFYLVKNQKIPSVGNLIGFFAKLETGWEKNISGDRVTIATLLKYISSMSAEDDPDCR